MRLAVGAASGCNRDTLQPNGRVRYTMLGEQQGKLFSTKLCPNATDGAMKTIVFTAGGSPVTIGNALQAGYQIGLFGGGRTESPLLAVGINDATTADINTNIHVPCAKFLGITP
jgi:hypothetical protein